MTEEDLPSVRSLMESIHGFWHDAWDDETLAKALESAGELALVFEDDGRILGVVFAHDLGFRAYLSELAVREDARGLGVGRRLLEHVEGILKQRRCELILADVWRSAEPCYRKLGWSDPDVVLLRKKLLDA
jgi:ribosomal protein S18 acetylase RimI-like enzyme